MAVRDIGWFDHKGINAKQQFDGDLVPETWFDHELAEIIVATTFFQNLVVNMTVAVVLGKRTSKILALGVTLTTAIAKRVGKLLSVGATAPGIGSLALVDSFSNTTDGTTFTGASVTPTANRLIIAIIEAQGASADGHQTVSSLSGYGLSWTEIDIDQNLDTAGAVIADQWIYAADTGASPSSTAFSVTFTGANRQGCSVHIFTVDGVDLSGGLAAAFVQFVPRSMQDGIAATSGTITLAAAGNAANRAFAWFIHEAAQVKTPGTNFTEIADTNHATPSVGAESLWRSDAFDTGPNASWVSSSLWGGYAFELKALLSNPGVVFTVALARMTIFGKALSVGITYTVSLAKRVGKLLPVTITHATALLKSVRKNLALGVTHTVGLVTEFISGGVTFFKDLVTSMTVTPVITKQTSKLISMGATFTAALTKRANKILSVAVTHTLALLKRVGHILPGVTVTFTPILTAIKVVLKALSVGVTYTVALSKQVSKSLALVSTFVVFFLKQTRKTFALGATFTVGLLKLVSKSFPITITYTLALLTIKVILRALSVGITYTVGFTKQVGKPFALGVTHTVAFVRRAGKVLVRGVTYTVAMPPKLILKNFPITVTYTVALTMIKVILRNLSVGISYTVALTKRSTRPLVVGITYTSALTKRAGKTLVLGVTYAVSFAGVRLGQVFQKALNVVVTYTPGLSMVAAARVISEMVSRALGHYGGTSPFRLKSPPRRAKR